MTKLTNPGAAAVDRARAPQVRGRVRRPNSVWAEFADHVLLETLPIVAIGAELTRGLKAGRFPLRAVLLAAVLAI
jgi:hypothetical protein